MSMTKDEVLTLYGDVPLKFSSYYKYSFSFVGEAPDGAIVAVSIGDADDIYRMKVTPDSVRTLRGDDHNYAHVRVKGEIVWQETEW